METAEIVLGAVLAQRLVELLIAKRNTDRLLDEGGVETGAEHYPYIVLLHAAWLAAMVLFIPGNAEANWWLLSAFLVLQAARVWVMATLGRRWTTRVIIIPGQALVRSGPYRFMKHPNYAIVAAEIALLPLVFGEWVIALIFSAFNAIVLRERIRVENEALRRADMGQR